MGVTDIDYNRLMRWLLPVALRKAKWLAWMRALLAPVRGRNYNLFKSWEAKSWYELKHQSGQVAYLEYVLNDKMGVLQHYIRIEDGLHTQLLYLYKDSEGAPGPYLYRDVEQGNELVVYLDSEVGTGLTGVDFLVIVPDWMGLQAREEELRALANRYKRDSKRYKILYLDQTNF